MYFPSAYPASLVMPPHLESASISSGSLLPSLLEAKSSSWRPWLATMHLPPFKISPIVQVGTDGGPRESWPNTRFCWEHSLLLLYNPSGDSDSQLAWYASRRSILPIPSSRSPCPRCLSSSSSETRTHRLLCPAGELYETICP